MTGKTDVLKQIAVIESLLDCVKRYERSAQLSLLDRGVEGPELHYDVGGPEKAWVNWKAG